MRSSARPMLKRIAGRVGAVRMAGAADPFSRAMPVT
jgi:hypothetical protein